MRDERPWLIAAWPGMGGVGVLAAAHLIEHLGAERLGELPAGDCFDLQEVEVRQGVMQPPRYPRHTLHRWHNPNGPDLVIMLAEAQPQVRGFSLCEALISRALDLEVGRVVTFAAMATPSDPRVPSRVHVMGTDAAIVEQAREAGMEPLEEGAISGMNGVLLAAARARELPGICLLGEFPYFASSLPQPKASAAVARAFARLSGIDIDVSALDERAREVEGQLVTLMQRLVQAARSQAEEGARTEEAPTVTEAEEEEPATSPVGQLEPAVMAQIEAQFTETERDRGRALELKALLDQHGVFKDYEDRFLDLFKHGE